MGKGMQVSPNQMPLSLGRLLSIRRLPGSIADLLMTSLFINLLGLALPVVILQVYDRIVPNSATGTLTLLLGGLGVALAGETLLRLLRSFVSSWIGARFEHVVGGKAVERLFKSNMADFERDGAGVHLERLEGLGALKDFYSGQALITVFDLPFTVLFLALIWYLAGNLVLVSVGLVAIFVVGATIIGMRLRNALHERAVADERRFNFIIEILGGIHTIKSMAMEPLMLRRYERLQETCAEHDHTVTSRSAAAMGIGALFSYLSLFATAGVGSIFVINGDLTTGGLAACTMLSGRAMQPLQRAMGLWSRFQTVHLARERLKEVFSLRPETAMDLPEIPDDIGNELEMRNVTFRYSVDGDDILTDVSVHARHGEIIGISGGNASGKTTLLYLMAGVLHPTEGQVLVDGQDLRRFNPASLHKKIAYLPQEGALFNGTIIENLTMFTPERIRQSLAVAKLLGLDDIVARMPFGYDTVVGEGAHDFLPRGIKQRLAIARALTPGPNVILFDEANMAMDAEGDNRLKTVLEGFKGRTTMILVTRRPSLLKIADKIYDLEGGRLTLREPEPPKTEKAS